MGVFNQNTGVCGLGELGMGYAGNLHNQICSDFTHQLKTEYKRRFQISQDITIHTIRSYKYPDVSIWEWNDQTELIKPFVLIEIADVSNITNAKKAADNSLESNPTLQECFIYYFSYNVWFRKLKNETKYQIATYSPILHKDLNELYLNCEVKGNIDREAKKRQRPYNLDGPSLI